MKDHIIAKEMCRGIQTSELAGAKSWTTILSRLMVSWTEKLSPGPSRNNQWQFKGFRKGLGDIIM